MPLSTTQYGFIIDPMVPFTDASGTTIRNGYVRIFMAGSSTPVITYKNYDGATNEETIQLDNSGRTAYPVIVSKGNNYKVCVYDAEHSQESPVLTIDKVVPAGANVSATNIVTGLDNVESPAAGWVKSTVSGTDAEVSLDATNVTSEVDTMVKATAASADYMMPLVHKTGSDPDKKITLGNILKFVLDNIVNLATTITSFASGDYIAVGRSTGAVKMSKDSLLQLTAQNSLGSIHSLTNTAAESDIASGNYFAIDGSAGTKKLNSTTLLTKTAQNALAGNVAPEFDPTKPNDEGGYAYYVRTNVTYEGKNYVFIANHYSGAWNPDEVEQRPLSETITTEGVGEAVNAWLDEHPEATTTVQNGSLTEQKFSDGLKLKAIKDYYTPQMFGAKGDGLTDDTESIQECIDHAFLNKKIVFIPSGDYFVSKPILVYGLDDEVIIEFASVIIGDSKGATRIIKTTSDVLEAPYDKNAVIMYANKKVVTGSGSGTRCYGVSIESISISGNGLADYGIALPLHTAEGTFRKLSISDCLDTGLKSFGNNYLNLYEQIRVTRCVECGIDIKGGTQTSDNLINCYVDTSKIGYKMGGVYMQMTDCCADNITDVVCDISGSHCTITSFGSESTAKVMFKGGQYTRATIINPTTWGNFTDVDAVAIDCGLAARMHFIGGTVSFDVLSQDRVAPGYLYTLGYAATLIIDGTQHSKYAKNPTNGGGGARCTYKSVDGSIFNRSSKLCFIGYDTHSSNGYVDAKSSTPEVLGNALFMGLGDEPTKTNNNDSISSLGHAEKGDILLSKSPADIGGIGWVEAKSHSPSDSWGSGEFLKIPVIQSGLTADRPTKRVKGQHYFDTTLNAPIFWNGTAWDSFFKRVSVTGTCDADGVFDSGLTEGNVPFAVIFTSRSGYRYSWYYYNSSWKIQAIGVSSGTPASGDFTVSVCYIESRFIPLPSGLNPS